MTTATRTRRPKADDTDTPVLPATPEAEAPAPPPEPPAPPERAEPLGWEPYASLDHRPVTPLDGHAPPRRVVYSPAFATYLAPAAIEAEQLAFGTLPGRLAAKLAEHLAFSEWSQWRARVAAVEHDLAVLDVERQRLQLDQQRELLGPPRGLEQAEKLAKIAADLAALDARIATGRRGLESLESHTPGTRQAVEKVAEQLVGVLAGEHRQALQAELQAVLADLAQDPRLHRAFALTLALERTAYRGALRPHWEGWLDDPATLPTAPPAEAVS
jgi:Fe-S cluster biosynthesis and repair protein YggX